MASEQGRYGYKKIAAMLGLSNQVWTWDEAFAHRLLERRQYNIRKLMEAHAMQNFHEEIDFPEMISIDESFENDSLPYQGHRKDPRKTTTTFSIGSGKSTRNRRMILVEKRSGKGFSPG